ncbi:MAG TPA: HAD hydrolase family protein [Acidimicrobiales bacterium]|nr:HAD hydrolase family protein [Acidimicrobiales bacterium]
MPPHPPRLPPGPVRLVATDLDGTLLDPDGNVSARTVAALLAARRAGLHVIPATGRPPKSTWEVAAVAGLGPIGVCANGAALVDLSCRQVVAVETLPAEDARHAVQTLRAVGPGVRCAVDDLERVTHEPGFFDLGLVWDEQVAVVPDITTVLGAGIIQMAARLHGWSASELIAAASPGLGERLNLTSSGLDWVEVNPRGVSKASRLAAVCNRLGIHSDEVVAVGDNLNDLPMLAWAGTGLAMANAVPDVLDAADGVVAANAEDGVAQLLEQLVARGPVPVGEVAG